MSLEQEEKKKKVWILFLQTNTYFSAEIYGTLASMRLGWGQEMNNQLLFQDSSGLVLISGSGSLQPLRQSSKSKENSRTANHSPGTPSSSHKHTQINAFSEQQFKHSGCILYLSSMPVLQQTMRVSSAFRGGTL